MIKRCAVAFRETALRAMDDMAPFNALVERIHDHGIGAVQEFKHFVVVPAIAPVNNKMSGKPGQLLESTWTKLLSAPLLLLVTAGCGSFATATTSLRRDAARVQQALRVVGRDPFGVTALTAGLPFDELLAWPGDDASLEHDITCAGCRARVAAAGGIDAPAESAGQALSALQRLVRAECVECRGRLDRFQQLLDIGARALVAARQHVKTKAKAMISWCGAEGQARAQRIRDTPGSPGMSKGLETHRHSTGRPDGCGRQEAAAYLGCLGLSRRGRPPRRQTRAARHSLQAFQNVSAFRPDPVCGVDRGPRNGRQDQEECGEAADAAGRAEQTG